MSLLASLHPHIHRFVLISSHPYILISSGLYALLASLHPHVLRFMCTACILASSHPHILRFMCACWYPRILTSLYPQVYACLLVCSHLQVNVFSIRMNICILASLSSLVLGNCASQFINNLQILRTGQAFVLDFYRTSRKIYRKQSLSADMKKKLLLKSRQNL